MSIHEGHFNHPSTDVWALGCVVWQLLAQQAELYTLVRGPGEGPRGPRGAGTTAGCGLSHLTRSLH